MRSYSSGKTLEIMGRRLRSTYDDWARTFTIHLTAAFGTDTIRVPLVLLRGIERTYASSKVLISVEWGRRETPLLALPVAALTVWPTGTTHRLASSSTWVAFETIAEDAHIVIRAPTAETRASGCPEMLARQMLSREVLGFIPWSTNDRPHLWPRYALYAGAAGQLILFTMGGQANGRFKLAKRQLEDFLALGREGSLGLGFYDTAQEIDVTYVVEGLKLPPLKNADHDEPCYMIDVASATRRTDQLQLAL